MVFREIFKRENIIAATIGLVAFFAYAAFSIFSTSHLYNSPDDHANAFFITHFAERGELWYSEPLNLSVQGRVVSRSMMALGSRVVPIGFPGLAIFYGILAKIFSVSAINYFTPVLVAMSSIILFFALRKRSDDFKAACGAMIYAFNPALWYYASRGLYPNAAVLALVVIAGAFMFLFEQKKTALAGSAIILAIAIFIRPVELIWIFPVSIGFIFFKFYRMNICAILSGIVFGVFASLLANHWVYGAWFSNGYSASLAAPDAFAVAAPGIKTVVKHLARFGIMIFPIHSLAMICAWLWLVSKKEYRKIAAVIAALVAFIVLPYVVFGARDLVGTGIPTIGTSFVRYWLPAFMIGAGVVIFVLEKIRSRGLITVVVAVYMLTSFYAVWYGTPDSLRGIMASLNRYDNVLSEVRAKIPSDSIIIVEQTDKVFFPSYRVVSWLRNPGTYEAIPELLKAAPVYYFGITFPPSDIETLTREKLPKDVSIELVKNFDGESLYQFSLKK
ncbi:MAG: hypothetical protein WCJ29_03550 [bacterium]